MSIRPQDFLSHEPTLWFRRHYLFWFRRTIFLRPQSPTKSVQSVVWCRSTSWLYKLWYSRLVSLSVQFLIHASSSICICLVLRICMMPDAFLMCAASASERVLAEPFWKAPRSPERSLRSTHCTCSLCAAPDVSGTWMSTPSKKDPLSTIVFFGFANPKKSLLQITVLTVVK